MENKSEMLGLEMMKAEFWSWFIILKGKDLDPHIVLNMTGGYETFLKGQCRGINIALEKHLTSVELCFFAGRDIRRKAYTAKLCLNSLERCINGKHPRHPPVHHLPPERRPASAPLAGCSGLPHQATLPGGGDT